MNTMFAMLGDDKPTKLYPEDVFSIDTYIGNATSQNIENGINLAALGGMVWTKMRNGTGTAAENNMFTSAALSSVSNYFTDSERGSNLLSPAWANGEIPGSSADLTFQAGGFSVGNADRFNKSGCTFASWTFRRAQRFFDVVKWKGDGSASRVLPHILGAEPGMIIVKRLDSASSRFHIYHRSLAGAGLGSVGLDRLAPSNATQYFGSHSASDFSITSDPGVNEAGVDYVAYLFAHDPSNDGIIQCGTYSTAQFGRMEVNLGWEPDFLIVRQTNASSWILVDSVRDFFENYLFPDANDREQKTNTVHDTSAVGFASREQSFNSPHMQRSNGTYVYVAIRRRGREPVTPESVLDVQLSPGPTAVSSAKFVDFSLSKLGGGWCIAAVRQYRNFGFRTGYNYEWVGLGGATWDKKNIAPNLYGGVSISFARATGVFDCQRYIGNGSIARRELPHQLGVVPELVMIKLGLGDSRNLQPWVIGSTLFPSADDSLLMYPDSALVTSGKRDMFAHARPTDKHIMLGQDAAVNYGGWHYLALAFASKSGISKVFKYEGNGSQQIIDCGFTNGARFVLIKRYDGTGNWVVFNSASGITSGIDPRFCLDNTAVQADLDCIDPSPSGFIIKQNTVNLNLAGAKYIGLALA